MNKQNIFLFFLALVLLGLTNLSMAGNVFTNASGDETWSNPANWSLGAAPEDSITDPSLYVPQWGNDCSFQTSNVTMIIGDGETHSSYSLQLGCYGGDNTVLNMNGGTLNIGPWGLDIGRGNSDQHSTGDGTLNMTGGTINVNSMLMVPQEWRNTGVLGTIAGTVNASGGVINASTMRIGMFDGIGTVKLSGNSLINLTGQIQIDTGWGGLGDPDSVHGGTLDLSGGKILLSTNQVGNIQPYIDNGWITFYGSAAPDQRYYTLDWNITTPGKTTLAANDPNFVDVKKAWNPIPNDKAVVDVTDGNILLHWNSGDPNGAYKHDVYFGDTNPPVYRTRINDVHDCNYIASAGILNTTYYWKINEYEIGTGNSIEGTTWSFTTADYMTVDDFNAADLSTKWTPSGSAVVDLVNNNSTMRISCGSGQSGSVYRIPPASDWNQQGLMALRLSFYGNVTNDPNAHLSVTLNNNTTVNYSGSLSQTAWTTWYIPYSTLDIMGVNLDNVTKIAVNVSSQSSSVVLLIDNIELTYLQCVNRPQGDFSDDCKISMSDFAEFARQWLTSGMGLP